MVGSAIEGAVGWFNQYRCLCNLPSADPDQFIFTLQAVNRSTAYVSEVYLLIYQVTHILYLLYDTVNTILQIRSDFVLADFKTLITFIFPVFLFYSEFFQC